MERKLEKRHSLERVKAIFELRLMKADKLCSLNQLTIVVAHDANHLMTIISLSAELLTPGMDGEQQQRVARIIGATESGKAITRGLLACARQQALSPARNTEPR